MKNMGEEWTRELKKGSIQLCLLAVISKGRKYGFQIIKELREMSSGY
jgi:DNA-binding PadR family transcriptional regulator